MWLDCKHVKQALVALSLKFVHIPTLKFTLQLKPKRSRGCEDLTIPGLYTISVAFRLRPCAVELDIGCKMITHFEYHISM